MLTRLWSLLLLLLSLQGEVERGRDLPRGATQQPHAVDREPGREERGPQGGDAALPQEGVQL